MDTWVFPRYNPAYIETRDCVKKPILYLYNGIFDLTNGIGYILGTTIEAIAYIVKAALGCVYWAVDLLFGWALRPIVDSFYTVNAVNGKRYFTFIPRQLENWIATNLLSMGLFKSFRPNQQQAEVETIFDKLVTAEGNQPFVKPEVYEYISDQISYACQWVCNEEDSANRETKPSLLNYNVTVYPSSVVNAFATLGGNVYVSSELIEQLQASFEHPKMKQTEIVFADGSTATVDLSEVTFDDALAAILGHELAHAAARHGVISLIFYLFVELVLSILPSNLLSYAIDLYGFAQSQVNEREADTAGAYFAQQAGYNPLGALYYEQFFLIGYGSSSLVDKLEEPLATHPLTEKRLQATFAAIHSFSPESLPEIEEVEVSKYDVPSSSRGVQYASSIIAGRVSTQRRTS